MASGPLGLGILPDVLSVRPLARAQALVREACQSCGESFHAKEHVARVSYGAITRTGAFRKRPNTEDDYFHLDKPGCSGPAFRDPYVLGPVGGRSLGRR